MAALYYGGQAKAIADLVSVLMVDGVARLHPADGAANVLAQTRSMAG
jgi:hypothetical protein